MNICSLWPYDFVIFCKHLMKENFGRRRVGESQELFVGSPTVLFFCINIEDLEEKRTFSQLDK